MLHELLFALMGYAGDIFVPYPPSPQKATTFSISNNFPFLHPTERESLNRLGHLGWIYSQINQFVKSVKKPSTKATEQPHGAYALAVAISIESTLNDYRQHILDIESRILNKEDEAGPNIIPLSLLTANLSKWELLLPSIWKLLQTLQTSPNEYHGCKIFNLLMDQARTGVLEYRQEIEKIIVQLHNVLYRQLTAWMVYGQWTDPDNEFFITPFKPTINNSSTTTAKTGWNRLYTIEYDKVPSYISHEVAESILFVGKAIATVNEMNKLSRSAVKREELSKSIQTSSHYQKITIPNDMKKKHLQLLLTLYNSNTSPSPWIKYPQELKKISSEVRRSTADWLFSQVLVGDHGLHKYLNSFRHLFLLNYGDLAANFIQQCDLWRKRSLTRPTNNREQSTAHKSSNTTSPVTMRTAMAFKYQELKALLGKASIGTDAEDQLSGYALLLEEEQTKEFPFSDLLLTDIRIVLTYELEWPIDLFLSESDLKKYSNIWSLLISMKSTQSKLSNLWKTLRNGDTALENTSNLELEQYNRTSLPSHQIEQENEECYQELLIWRLRSLMLFWTDTVWNHIQTNVIDSHYQQLIDTTTPNASISKRRPFQPKAKLDFEEIQAAHEHFLNSVINGCLLSSEECVQTVHDILLACSRFCELMERISEEGDWRKSKRRKTSTKSVAEIVKLWTKAADCDWMEQVRIIEEEFISKTEYFFNLTSSQHPDVKFSGRLDVLLMQLDYNKWFSNQRSRAKLFPNTATA